PLSTDPESCVVRTCGPSVGVAVIDCVANQPAQEEACNGEDDDCDGEVDEGNPNGGTACTDDTRLGVCAQGTLVCQDGSLVCPSTIEPTEEVCNGLDDNCDGVVDDGNPEGGFGCITDELGVCALGEVQCVEGELVCATLRTPMPETCNGLDDDCDGMIDEEDPNEGVSCTSDRFGACAPGVLICQENNLVCVSDIEPTEEVCNGIDDNCDGIVDDGNPEGGDSCGTGQMGACAQGTLTCQEGSVVCLANAQPTSEVCNGIDDDCDGLIDEDGSGCGPYVQQRCRLYMGSAEGGTGPAIGSLSDRWERCPYQTDFDNGGPVRCSGTRGDGRFSILPLGHQVNGDDKFGLSMHCNDGAHPAQARYIEEHCAVFFAYADSSYGPPLEGQTRWGSCPNALVDNSGTTRCTSTGLGQPTRRFRPFSTDDALFDRDELGVAWICRDDNNPGRAAVLQRDVWVYMGQADNDAITQFGSATWGTCPASPSSSLNNIRCTSSRGDGRFHLFRPAGRVDGNDAFGWAIRAAP
ncbi:MAG: MopE-related protein, partial [Myxococcota bacterium]